MVAPVNTVDRRESDRFTEAEVADVELVRRARDGDRDAFDLLMTSVVDHLYRIGRLILRDTDRAEDAVQETLVRCWRHLPSLRDAERFDPWLNRLLMHAIADEGRRHRAFTASVVVLRAEPRQPDGSDELADRDELARAFDRLSIPHRTAVVLHHYLGFTVEEIGRVVGVPSGTAKSRLYYATNALRAALDADERATSSSEVLA
jgi:RNA polymerase sigma-70 factor, ECF subfamily